LDSVRPTFVFRKFVIHCKLIFAIHRDNYGDKSARLAPRRGERQFCILHFCNSPRPQPEELKGTNLQFTTASIRRIEEDKSVSENDDIFCNPNFFEIEVGLQKMASFFQFSISLKLGIELAPRRGERQKCNW
jgi:hypothetical protein